MNQIDKITALADAYAQNAAWDRSTDDSDKQRSALRAAIEQALKMEQLNYAGALEDLAEASKDEALLRQCLEAMEELQYATTDKAFALADAAIAAPKERLNG